MPLSISVEAMSPPYADIIGVRACIETYYVPPITPIN
jgi:hypothetical protein